MLRRRRLLWILLLALIPTGVRGQALIADLSKHLIAITTAFTGAEVLLFGTVEKPGGDVVVLVFGPPEELRVRRKSRVGPFWFNTDEMRFRGVPGFYAVASSKPLELLAEEDVLRRYRIGVERLDFEARPDRHHDEADLRAFRDALVRAKQRQELYVRSPIPVYFLGNRLFRTVVPFPANVPPGNYQVQTLYLRDGQVVQAQSNVLVVSKVGVEADIFDLARRRPALYGLSSILIAVAAGWTASLVFARR